MKQYKIVKHYVEPEDYMFRVYQRQFLFFWKWLTSFNDIQSAERHINWRKSSEIEKKAKVNNTPKPATIAYL